MDTNTLIAVLVPSVLSIVLATVNIFMAHRKDKTRKQELAWNTATQQLLALMEKNRVDPDPQDALERVRYFQFVYQALCCIAHEDSAKLQQLQEEAPFDWIDAEENRRFASKSSHSN